MKKNILITILTATLHALVAQNYTTPYTWSWSAMNYTCPSAIVSYPTQLDYGLGPRHLEIDSMGNVYAFGLMEVYNGSSYTLASNMPSATTYNYNDPFSNNASYTLYFMKMDATGQLLWSKDIISPNTWEGMSTELIVDPLTGTSYLQLLVGGTLIINQEFVSSPFQTGSNPVLVFDAQGDLADTLWSYGGMFPADSGIMVVKLTGPFNNQYQVERYNGNSLQTVQTFYPQMPGFFYHPYTGKYIALTGASNIVQIYSSDLVLESSNPITGNAPAMLGTDFKITFMPDGGMIIMYYYAADYRHTIVSIDANYAYRWHKDLDNHDYIVEADADGNPWLFNTYPGETEGYAALPYGMITSMAIKLDTADGSWTGEYISPTNATHSQGGLGFKIDHENRFYMSGSFWYEIEFSTTLLSQSCSNNAFARMQYIAMAVPGDDSTRFNLGVEELESMISVYPNPFADKIFVQAEAEISQLAILNLNGQTIHQQSFNAFSAELDLTFLPAGIYILQLTSEGVSGYKKIIKQ